MSKSRHRSNSMKCAKWCNSRARKTSCCKSAINRAFAVITNSVSQPNANAHRAFEVLGTNGTAVLRPLEPGTLVFDLAKAAGPYRAGAQDVPLPAFERYVGDFANLAEAVRGEKP